MSQLPFVSSSGIITKEDAAATGTFTPKMRDRQARGKDPYNSSNNGSSFSSDSEMTDGEMSSGFRQRRRGDDNGRAPPKEDFETRERQEKALAFLDNPELLMMYAQSTGNSIPGARLHFMKMLCGYDKEEEKSKQQQQQQAQHPHRRDADSSNKRRGGDRGAMGSGSGSR
ncbi:hypothetical protein B0T17DRAFT_513797 [Bombardia bombarda]|uniref:Uncharacterized protein n=1 Tax=Bombardia bombarda TaxID=252184 RepID=A0AA39XJ46_9PEZI|nr:hypothetical protein B0T17DRAFT_513797 [Bombardia bombarda]